MKINAEVRDLVDALLSQFLIRVLCTLLQDAFCAFIPTHVNRRQLKVLGSRRWYPGVLPASGLCEFSTPPGAAAIAIVSAAAVRVDCRENRWEEQVENWAAARKARADDAHIGLNYCPHGGSNIV